ncbi:hypothetical protein D3C84_1089410 [compost metagenome]
MQVGALIRRRVGLGIEADQHQCLGGFAAGAEQQALLTRRGRVPVQRGAGAQGDPGQPGGKQTAALHPAAGGGVVHLGNGAEADQVIEATGEFGEAVHAPMVTLLCARCTAQEL